MTYHVQLLYCGVCGVPVEVSRELNLVPHTAAANEPCQGSGADVSGFVGLAARQPAPKDPWFSMSPADRFASIGGFADPEIGAAPKQPATEPLTLAPPIPRCPDCLVWFTFGDDGPKCPKCGLKLTKPPVTHDPAPVSDEALMGVMGAAAMAVLEQVISAAGHGLNVQAEIANWLEGAEPYFRDVSFARTSDGMRCDLISRSEPVEGYGPDLATAWRRAVAKLPEDQRPDRLCQQRANSAPPDEKKPAK